MSKKDMIGNLMLVRHFEFAQLCWIKSDELEKSLRHSTNPKHMEDFRQDKNSSLQYVGVHRAPLLGNRTLQTRARHMPQASMEGNHRLGIGPLRFVGVPLGYFLYHVIPSLLSRLKKQMDLPGTSSRRREPVKSFARRSSQGKKNSHDDM